MYQERSHGHLRRRGLLSRVSWMPSNSQFSGETMRHGPMLSRKKQIHWGLKQFLTHPLLVQPQWDVFGYLTSSQVFDLWIHLLRVLWGQHGEQEGLKIHLWHLVLQLVVSKESWVRLRLVKWLNLHLLTIAFQLVKYQESPSLSTVLGTCDVSLGPRTTGKGNEQRRFLWVTWCDHLFLGLQTKRQWTFHKVSGEIEGQCSFDWDT